MFLGAAALLAATALAVRRQARRAEASHPPGGRFVEVDGVRLHYLEKGTGSAVLLLHGNGVTAEDFVGSGLVDELSQRYRVIAFDRPGYGYSDRPPGRLWTPRAQAALLAAACAELGVERAVVVGHSFGTLVALAMAQDFPALTRALVLVSGYYFPTPRIDSLLLAVPAIPLLGSLMRYTVSPLLGRWVVPRMVRRMFAPDPVPLAFGAAVPLPIMLRPWQLRASAQDAGFMVASAAGLRRRYAELGLPVFVVAGEGDRIVKPAGQSLRLGDRLAGAQGELLQDTGHMLHYAHAGRVAQAVDRAAVSEQVAAGRPEAANDTQLPEPLRAGNA